MLLGFHRYTSILIVEFRLIVASFNKAIKKRTFHALDSQQVARLLWQR